MLRHLAALCLVLSAGACTSLEGPTADQISQSDDNQCQSYGLTPGTSGYASCRIQIDQGRQNRRAAIGMALLSRPQAPTYIPTPVVRTPVICNSMGAGSMITTSCY